MTTETTTRRAGPTLRTERLVLRPFTLGDAPDVRRLAGEWEIADTTLSVPHPYEEGMAEEWIGGHAEAWASGRLANFAITLAATGELVGAIGLGIKREHEHAELGYWIGKPYWDRGYCTEAAAAILDFGFEALKLHRIFAHHFVRNPASGAVLRKIGMRHEGHARGHVRKWDSFEDLDLYGILRDDPRIGYE